METNEKNKIISYPSVTKALGEGFSNTAENLYLVILPILADILIWLGPKFRVYELLRDQIDLIFNELNATAPQELSAQISAFYDSMKLMIEQINLMGILGAFPFSLPVLLNGIGPLTGPVGGMQIIEVRSVFLAILLFVFLGIIGLLIGIFYYTIIAQASNWSRNKLTLHSFIKIVLNIILLLLALLGICLVLLIPVSFFFTLLALLSVTLAQLVLLGFFLGLAWLIIPSFFIVPGIFISNLKLLDAVKLSFRMSRWVSGTTSFFIVAGVIIAQGLNLIWTIPSTDSWLQLIGIAGHAFIVTALVSASFVLYQQNLQWLSDNAEIVKKGIIRK